MAARLYPATGTLTMSGNINFWLALLLLLSPALADITLTGQICDIQNMTYGFNGTYTLTSFLDCNQTFNIDNHYIFNISADKNCNITINTLTGTEVSFDSACPENTTYIIYQLGNFSTNQSIYINDTFYDYLEPENGTIEIAYSSPTNESLIINCTLESNNTLSSSGPGSTKSLDKTYILAPVNAKAGTFKIFGHEIGQMEIIIGLLVFILIILLIIFLKLRNKG